MCLGRRQAEPCLAGSGRLQAKGSFYSPFIRPHQSGSQYTEDCTLTYLALCCIQQIFLQ